MGEKEICKKSLMDTSFFSYYTERNSGKEEQNGRQQCCEVQTEEKDRRQV